MPEESLVGGGTGVEAIGVGRSLRKVTGPGAVVAAENPQPNTGSEATRAKDFFSMLIRR